MGAAALTRINENPDIRETFPVGHHFHADWTWVNHRARLMVKMQADSVADLVRMALVAGISAKNEGQTGEK